MNIVRSSASPRLLRHHRQLLRYDFHRVLSHSLVHALLRREQFRGFRINERGFGSVRLADRRRSLQHVVLSTEQLLEPFVVLLFLVPVRSSGPGRGGWCGTLPARILAVPAVGQVQLRIQIQTEPLREESYPLFRAGWHRRYELLGVQRVVLVLRRLGGLCRLDGATRKFEMQGN